MRRYPSRIPPPPSDLCVTSGEFIFTATGKPIRCAASTASSSLPAGSAGVTGNPFPARNAIDSDGGASAPPPPPPPPLLPRRTGDRPLRHECFPVEPRVAGQGSDRPLRRREDGDLLFVHLPPLLPFHEKKIAE